VERLALRRLTGIFCSTGPGAGDRCGEISLWAAAWHYRWRSAASVLRRLQSTLSFCSLRGRQLLAGNISRANIYPGGARAGKGVLGISVFCWRHRPCRLAAKLAYTLFRHFLTILSCAQGTSACPHLPLHHLPPTLYPCLPAPTLHPTPLPTPPGCATGRRCSKTGLGPKSLRLHPAYAAAAPRLTGAFFIPPRSSPLIDFPSPWHYFSTARGTGDGCLRQNAV